MAREVLDDVVFGTWSSSRLVQTMKNDKCANNRSGATPFIKQRRLALVCKFSVSMCSHVSNLDTRLLFTVVVQKSFR